MARAHWVKSSRKEHTCGKGPHVIPVGEGYYWAKPGFRRRTPLIRCKNHPFRPSELTTSARSGPLSAIEAFEDAAAAGFDTVDDLQSAWDELGEALEEYVQDRDYALEQWEHGNSQLEDLRDQAQQAHDDWEGHTIAEWSGDDEPERSDYPDDEEGQAEYDEAFADWEEAHTQHVQEQTDEALEVAGGLDV